MEWVQDKQGRLASGSEFGPRPSSILHYRHGIAKYFHMLQFIRIHAFFFGFLCFRKIQHHKCNI